MALSHAGHTTTLTLTTDLSDGQRLGLDALLKLRGGSKISAFTWLRLPPGPPTSQNILLHIERLQHIRNLELRSDLNQLIHQNRLLQLAREGAATTSQHLARFDNPRRHGTLVAVLLEASSTLTDEILDLHDRFVGSIFNKARRRRDEVFQSSGKAINEKVRLYARIGQALLAAKENGADLRDRSFENQRYRASGLNLIVAAIILWNTAYLERAIAALKGHGIAIDDEALAHLSPIGWEHVNLTR